jgi:hypothetical protein
MAETTEMWKGFKLTERYHDGEHCGWEAQCYNPDHGEKACKRTLRFSEKVSKDRTLRRLMWWCLESPNYLSQALHVRACPKEPVDTPLPEVDALEAQPAPVFGNGAQL